MVLTSEPARVAMAEWLVFPGVGAFEDGMEGLRRHGLVEAFHRFAEKERPFLGICLGMQMLLETSEEFGEHQGLGVIPGRVVAIAPTGTNGRPHKIPHIGWTAIEAGASGLSWENTILRRISPGTPFYFVHSYTAEPDRSENRLADSFYHGRRLSAVIRKGHLYGTQFHPEKSGASGLKLLQNFLEL